MPHTDYSPSQSSKVLPWKPAQPVTGFQYEPLNSSVDTIRLIVLHPRRKAEKETVVRCSLIHSNFLSKPKYEALSYTWGNPNYLKNIYINGSEVPVRENLYSALCCLQLEQDRLLWADAICIDQSNLEERRYQVGLMPFIYSRADCVLVWLGQPGLPEVEHVLEKASFWMDNIPDSEIILGKYPSPTVQPWR